jgi:hypothetical protein
VEALPGAHERDAELPQPWAAPARLPPEPAAAEEPATSRSAVTGVAPGAWLLVELAEAAHHVSPVKLVEVAVAAAVVPRPAAVSGKARLRVYPADAEPVPAEPEWLPESVVAIAPSVR